LLSQLEENVLFEDRSLFCDYLFANFENLLIFLFLNLLKNKIISLNTGEIVSSMVFFKPKLIGSKKIKVTLSDRSSFSQFWLILMYKSF